MRQALVDGENRADAVGWCRGRSQVTVKERVEGEPEVLTGKRAGGDRDGLQQQ